MYGRCWKTCCVGRGRTREHLWSATAATSCGRRGRAGSRTGVCISPFDTTLTMYGPESLELRALQGGQPQQEQVGWQRERRDPKPQKSNVACLSLESASSKHAAAWRMWNQSTLLTCMRLPWTRLSSLLPRRLLSLATTNLVEGWDEPSWVEGVAP